MEDMDAFERQLATVMQQGGRASLPVDATAIVHSATTTSPSGRWTVITGRLRGDTTSASTDRGFSVFSALKLVAAGVIVALFGGFLLAGVLTTPQGDEVAPAAVTAPAVAEATSEPTGSPDPSVRTDLLPGVTLAVEEVETGVYRVLGDGVRDLGQASNRGWLGQWQDIVAGHDDGIWLLRERELLRLGSDGSHGWPLQGTGPESHVFEVAPDGTMWVTGNRYGSELWNQYPDARGAGSFRSTDDEEWTVEPCPRGSDLCRGLAVAPDGTAWTSWREEGGQWRVGHLGLTGWQPLDGYVPRLTAQYGYDRLFVTAAGDVYGVDYYMGELRRYADGDWQPVPGGSLIDVGRDGTVWLAGGLGNDGSFRGDDLARFADGEWAHWTSADLPDIRLGLDYEFEVAPDGSLWFGLWRTADGELPAGDSWIDDWFRAVRDDRLVCDGLARFDGVTLDRFLPGQCASMDIAADGSVWVLADDEGGRDLYVITPEAVPTTEAVDIRAVTTTTSDILPGVTLTVEKVEPGVFRVVDDGVRDMEQVTMAAVGEDGSVWMDSASGIVELGRPGDHPGLVDGQGFLSFTQDGTMWAVSGESPADLRSFDGETWTQRGMMPDGIATVPEPWWPGDYITDFAVHPDGTIWQVAEQNGDPPHTRVQHLGTDSWTTYDVRDEVAALGWCGICADGEPCPGADCEGSWDLEITPDGTVWVGMGIPPRHESPISGPSGGLLRFDGTDWEVARPLGGDEDHGVSALAANRDGDLWAECATGDLARFDGRAWEIFSNASARDPGLGRIMAVDPDGNLWAGWDYDWFGWDYDSDDDIASDPRCDGVRRFDGSTWTTFLPGMCVSDLDFASDGAVWVTLPSDPSLDWIPGYGHGSGLYVITPEAVAATE